MKYAIQVTRKLIASQSTEYPKFIGYVKRFQLFDRRAKPLIDWTPYLSQAILYDDCRAATCIKNLINRAYENESFAQLDAEILTFTEKEIFKAKLTSE